MRVKRNLAVLTATGVLLALAACGDAGSESDGPDIEVKEDAAAEFDDGTRMKELADAGTIKVGVKYDQPGLGYKDAASDIPTGFDIEMAKIVAGDLGIAPDCVNVKGKTNEKLGYLGRAEAIEAQAVVLLTRAPA